MLVKRNKRLTGKARRLRKNMTKEERHLWYDFLKEYPAKFTRQKVLGKYIADFYCASARLVIELDGNQHYVDDGVKRDYERDAYIKKLGISVIRFTNLEIAENFEGVCLEIDKYVKRIYIEK